MNRGPREPLCGILRNRDCETKAEMMQESWQSGGGAAEGAEGTPCGLGPECWWPHSRRDVWDMVRDLGMETRGR